MLQMTGFPSFLRLNNILQCCVCIYIYTMLSLPDLVIILIQVIVAFLFLVEIVTQILEKSIFISQVKVTKELIENFSFCICVSRNEVFTLKLTLLFLSFSFWESHFLELDCGRGMKK